MTGLVTPERGAPRLIRFYDPSAAQQPHLYATWMRVANARGDLALKNTSDLAIIVHPQFLDRDSGQPLFELPSVTLPAYAAKTVDLSPAITALSASGAFEAVGIRVESNGPPGALIGSIYMQDATTGTPFDVPLRDSGTSRKATGSYPWRIDDDYETRVSITNAGPIPAKFVARVAHEGGELVFAPRELAVGASASFDLRQIRDQQINDWAGRALPLAATSGRFLWTAHGSGSSARLVGRAEVVSVRFGVSSSYSCGQCCPDSFLYGLISPYERLLGVGTTDVYDVSGQYQNCYGSEYSVAMWPASWSVAIPSVASAWTENWGVGRVSGDSEGTTNVSAFWAAERWEPFGEDCVLDEWTHEEPASAEVTCAKPVNFRETIGKAAPGGELRFEYRWDSSTGSLPDLGHCQVGEKVDYTPWPFPSPPFQDSPPNPTVVNAQASDGVFSDIHTTGQPFLQPYSQVSTFGSQVYRHNCRCAVGDPEWITLLTPFPGLVRKFESNGDGTWRFTASKSGVSSVINPLPQ